MKREAAVAGVFYPGDKKSLSAQLKHYLNQHQENDCLSPIRALIVPHAGYVYSGGVAADAYLQIKGQHFDTVFLIGSSHKASFKGAALPAVSTFATPLGDVPLHTDIISELCANSSLFDYRDEVHHDEYSLEVQLPFLQYLLSDYRIVPILIGSKDIQEIEAIAHQLEGYFTSANLFVVSSDFSHYPPAVYAQEEDSATTKVICLNQPGELIQHLENQKESLSPNLLTGLCGWSAVLVLQYMTQTKPVVYTPLSYEHSGMKLSKDTSRVVGYQAIAISEKKEVYALSQQEKNSLLNIARHAIRSHLNETTDEALQLDIAVSGVFVSVYCQDELRGCIGRFESSLPLGELIGEMAVDAAFYDTRFKAVVADELEDLHLEISLLTPLKLIQSTDEIEVGRHGVYIKKGFNHGTFLPVVGVRNEWSVDELLGHCARDKAKIGWEGWKDAEIYTYEAMIISDDDGA